MTMYFSRLTEKTVLRTYVLNEFSRDCCKVELDRDLTSGATVSLPFSRFFLRSHDPNPDAGAGTHRCVPAVDSWIRVDPS